MTVSMEVQSVGGSDQYTASIRQQQVSPRRDTWNPSGERWRRNADGSIELIKQLTCTIIKPGERETELELYLASTEFSPHLLRLADSTSQSSGNDWAYINHSDEGPRFFRSLTHGQFYVNHFMVTTLGDQEPIWKIRSVQDALMNGDTTSFVTIHFSGELRGAYDPGGEFGTFIVEDGVFRGVIE